MCVYPHTIRPVKHCLRGNKGDLKKTNLSLIALPCNVTPNKASCINDADFSTVRANFILRNLTRDTMLDEDRCPDICTYSLEQIYRYFGLMKCIVAISTLISTSPTASIFSSFLPYKLWCGFIILSCLLSSVAIATPYVLLHFCLAVRREEELKKENKDMCSWGGPSSAIHAGLRSLKQRYGSADAVLPPPPTE